tara:strand:- start:107 stop:301 length:195 start_codon:yes stop_codon:yes gene_type:complete
VVEMDWKKILKEEMTEEERKKYMKRLAELQRLEENMKRDVEGTAEAFREGESLEQYKKRMGYNF